MGELSYEQICLPGPAAMDAVTSESGLAAFVPHVGQILQSTRDCIELLDAEGHLLWMNAEGQERLGVTNLPPVRNTVWADLWVGAGGDHAHRAVRRARAGQHSRFEAAFLSPDGQSTWWDVSVTAIGGVLGGSSALLAVSRGITPRKRVEEALEQQCRQLELVVDQVPALMAYVDPSGRYLWTNRLYQEWYGITDADTIGRDAMEVMGARVDPAYAAQIRPRLRRALNGERMSFEADLQLQGLKRRFSVCLTPDHAPNGAVRGCIVLVTDITSQYEVTQALSASVDQFRTLTEALPSVVWSTAPDGSMEYLSERFQAVTGQEIPSGLGAGWAKVIHPEDLQRFFPVWQAALDSGTSFESRYRVLQASGSYRWFLARALPQRMEDGQILRWVGVSTDVHDQVEIEQALRASESTYRLLFENNPHPMWTYDTRTLAFLSVNEAATAMYGYSAEEFLRMSIRDIRPPEDMPDLESALRGLGEADSARVVRHRRKDGSFFWVELLTHNIEWDRSSKARLVLASDVTERVRLHEHLVRLANHDALTGLPNRQLLARRSEQAINSARALGHRVAMLAIDFDRFKQVNDTFGHEAGDEFLAAAAARLQSLLGESDTLARVGGDEFTAVLGALPSIEQGLDLANKLVESLSGNIRAGGLELQSSISIGIAFFPDDGQEVADLQRSADQALYAAKRAGRNCIRRFSISAAAAVADNMKIEDGLRTAIERNRLQLQYQPIVSPDGRIQSLEALLRFDHESLGPVSPARFIPIAEQSGLILRVGEWVIREACRQIAVWRAEGKRAVPVSVNVSALQFSPGDLAKRIEEALRDAGIPAQLLHIELTESVLMADMQGSARILAELKQLGVSIAIDDFGTGYSSLSYLHDLPLDKLKIDRSFVQRIGAKGEEKPIVQAIIHLAKNLGLQVVGEGVESAEQRDALVRFGCDLLQGYLFAHPADAACIGMLLNTGTDTL